MEMECVTVFTIVDQSDKCRSASFDSLAQQGSRCWAGRNPGKQAAVLADDIRLSIAAQPFESFVGSDDDIFGSCVRYDSSKGRVPARLYQLVAQSLPLQNGLRRVCHLIKGRRHPVRSRKRHKMVAASVNSLDRQEHSDPNRS